MSLASGKVLLAVCAAVLVTVLVVALVDPHPPLATVAEAGILVPSAR